MLSSFYYLIILLIVVFGHFLLYLRYSKAKSYLVSVYFNSSLIKSNSQPSETSSTSKQ